MKWLERGLMLLACYVISEFIVQARLEQLRGHVIANGIKEGVAAGVAEYEKTQIEARDIRERKREIRDRLLQGYVAKLTGKLNAIIEVTK